MRKEGKPTFLPRSTASPLSPKFTDCKDSVRFSNFTIQLRQTLFTAKTVIEEDSNS